MAKVTYFDGGDREPVLAIAHRYQHGTISRISLPVSVIQFAIAHGVRWFYFRRDITGEMWRMPLTEVETCDLGPSIGGMEAERYVEIAKMEPVQWRKWAWADRVVQLTHTPATNQEPMDQHLVVFGGEE